MWYDAGPGPGFFSSRGARVLVGFRGSLPVCIEWQDCHLDSSTRPARDVFDPASVLYHLSTTACGGL